MAEHGIYIPEYYIYCGHRCQIIKSRILCQDQKLLSLLLGYQ